jgi:predicted DNA-binding transcriptional regulator AlpA
MTEEKLLKSSEVAKRIGYGIARFKAVIKHQKDFPKPFKAHEKAHPKWRESDINQYLNRG